MMWTILPIESLPADGTSSVEPEEIICRQGVLLSAVRDSAGSYRVRRLISTEPNDYLIADLAPNSILI